MYDPQYGVIPHYRHLLKVEELFPSSAAILEDCDSHPVETSYSTRNPRGSSFARLDLSDIKEQAKALREFGLEVVAVNLVLLQEGLVSIETAGPFGMLVEKLARNEAAKRPGNYAVAWYGGELVPVANYCRDCWSFRLNAST